MQLGKPACRWGRLDSILAVNKLLCPLTPRLIRSDKHEAFRTVNAPTLLVASLTPFALPSKFLAVVRRDKSRSIQSKLTYDTGCVRLTLSHLLMLLTEICFHHCSFTVKVRCG